MLGRPILASEIIEKERQLVNIHDAFEQVNSHLLASASAVVKGHDIVIFLREDKNNWPIDAIKEAYEGTNQWRVRVQDGFGVPRALIFTSTNQ